MQRAADNEAGPSCGAHLLAPLPFGLRMGKKHAHVSVAAYWVPSDKPALAALPRVSKKHQAKSAVQHKLDPKQRARLAAASKGKGKGKGKGGKSKKGKR